MWPAQFEFWGDFDGSSKCLRAVLDYVNLGSGSGILGHHSGCCELRRSDFEWLFCLRESTSAGCWWLLCSAQERIFFC